MVVMYNFKKEITFEKTSLLGVKGHLAVPLTVYPCIYCVYQGFLGIITHRYPLYRAHIGISHRDTSVGYIQLSPDGGYTRDYTWQIFGPLYPNSPFRFAGVFNVTH